MSEKKPKWSPIKEILFTYLAVNKILYWLNTILSMDQGNLSSAVGVVMARIFAQDMPIIISIVAFYFLEKLIRLKKSKYSKILEHVTFYVVGYVVIIGVSVVYAAIASLFLGPVQVDSWTALITYSIIGYLVVIAVLHIKEYFKGKAKPEYAPPAPSTDDKLAMLKILFDNGVLTQEEFGRKKEMLGESA